MCVVLEVFSLGSVAAFTSVWVERAGVKRFAVVGLTEFYIQRNTKSSPGRIKFNSSI